MENNRIFNSDIERNLFSVFKNEKSRGVKIFILFFLFLVIVSILLFLIVKHIILSDQGLLLLKNYLEIKSKLNNI